MSHHLLLLSPLLILVKVQNNDELVFMFLLCLESMEIDKSDNAGGGIDHPINLVKVLRGHESEVFTCAWSPSGNLLVTG